MTDDLHRLPRGLAADDLRMVLAETPTLTGWPDGAMFVEADQPAAFSRLLRRAWHPHLEAARIAHLFRDKLHGEGCQILARAKRAGPELQFLGNVDFVLTYAFRSWEGLTLWQQLAVVDHELSHCGHDPDRGWVTLPHDLEEFSAIARRWGDWEPSITAFRRQLDLFAGAGA